MLTIPAATSSPPIEPAIRAYRAWWLPLLLGAVAGIALWLVLRWGLALFAGDSLIYLDAARNLRDGNGFVASLHGGPTLPVSEYPPLYSATIAAAGSTISDIQQAAKVANVLLFAASVALVAWLILEAGGGPLLAGLAAVLFACSPPVLDHFSTPLSEPLFLFLSVAGLLPLARFARTQSWTSLVLAAVILGSTAAVRYSGIVWVASGALAVLLIERGGIVPLLAKGIAFGVIAFTPGLLVAIRNRSIVGNTVNREIHWHPPHSAAPFLDFCTTVANWFLPARFATWHAGAIIAVLLFVVSIVILWRWRNFPVSARGLLIGGGIFAAAYLAHLVITLYFLVFDLPFDDRILSPVEVVTILALTFLPLAFRKGAMRQASLIALCFLAALFMVRGANWGRQMYAEGKGYRSRWWQQSQVVQALAKIPPGVPVYSNKPESVYMLIGRSVPEVPEKEEKTNRTVNPRFAEDLDLMLKQLKERGGYVMFIRPDAGDVDYSADKSGVPVHRMHQLSEAELRQKATFSEVAGDSGSVLLKYNNTL